MFRTTAITFVSTVALGVSLASPAGAMGSHVGSGAMHSGNTGGGAIHGAPSAGGSMTAMRSGASGPGSFAPHDTGRMRMEGDRDHDRDHDHDRFHHRHDRFRFFPAFAFGVDTYDDCWELHRVRTTEGWRLRRIWVCN